MALSVSIFRRRWLERSQLPLRRGLYPSAREMADGLQPLQYRLKRSFAAEAGTRDAALSAQPDESRCHMVITRRTVPRKVPLQRLRNHPKIHWPPGVGPNPPWAGPSPEIPEPSRITLTKVEMVEAGKHAGPHLTLTGLYGGNIYRTTLTIDDPALLANLCESLRRCVGETITVVGSHAVDQSLNRI